MTVWHVIHNITWTVLKCTQFHYCVMQRFLLALAVVFTHSGSQIAAPTSVTSASSLILPSPSKTNATNKVHFEKFWLAWAWLGAPGLNYLFGWIFVSITEWDALCLYLLYLFYYILFNRYDCLHVSSITDTHIFYLDFLFVFVLLHVSREEGSYRQTM